MPKDTVCLAAALLCVASALHAQIPSQFTNRTVGGLTATAHGRAADFDGDGSTDLLLAIDGELRLLRNDGTGELSTSTIAAAPDVVDLEIGDLDGDGDMDAYVTRNASGAVASWRVMRNDGRGGFTAEPLVGPQALLSDTHLSDVDLDGDLDVIHVGLFSTLDVFANDGSGHFSRRPGVLPTPPVAVASKLIVGDFNGDGRDDFMLPGSAPALILSSPAGFLVGPPPPPAARSTLGVAADFDGDGSVDAIAVRLGSAFLLRGDGAGSFSAVPLSFPTDFRELIAADFDEDGDIDVVAADYGFSPSPPAYFFANDGQGNLSNETARRFRAGQDAGSLPIPADLDGDGDLDLYLGANTFGLGPGQDRVFINRHVHVEVTGAVQISGSLTLECASRTGYGTGVDLALVVVGAEATAAVPTPFGRVHVDPTGSVPLPVVSLPSPRGLGTLTVPVPSSPALVGLELVAQALIVDLFGATPPRLTNFDRFAIR